MAFLYSVVNYLSPTLGADDSKFWSLSAGYAIIIQRIANTVQVRFFDKHHQETNTRFIDIVAENFCVYF